MIILKGKYSTATVMADSGEEEAISQIMHMLNSPAITNPVAIMPDFHSGKGSVIGFTMKVGEYVIPNIVGVDIGCGMLSTMISYPDEWDLKKVDELIRSVVPLGFSVHTNSRIKKYKGTFDKLAEEVGMDVSYLEKSVGTLGGGNHFIELGQTSENDLWITIHTGSRNFGLKVAEYFQSRAVKFCEGKAGVEKGLEFLPVEEYLEAMCLVQQYAELNRTTILHNVLNVLNVVPREFKSCVHNYINLDDRTIRKGAVSAQKDADIILPFNRRDGIWVMKGRGNPDWNFSAPHGSGRKMSRGEAKRTLSQEYVDKEMHESGVYSSINPVDEAPDAYKDTNDITKNIGETAEFLFAIKPILNIKG